MVLVVRLLYTQIMFENGKTYGVTGDLEPPRQTFAAAAVPTLPEATLSALNSLALTGTKAVAPCPNPSTFGALDLLTPGWHESLVSIDSNAVPPPAANHLPEPPVTSGLGPFGAISLLKPGWHDSISLDSNAIPSLATNQPSKSVQPPATSEMTPFGVLNSLKPGWHKTLSLDSNVVPRPATDRPPIPKSPPPIANSDLASFEALGLLKPGWHESLVSINSNITQTATTTIQPCTPNSLQPEVILTAAAAAAPDLDPQTSSALNSLDLRQFLQTVESNRMSSGPIQPVTAPVLDAAASEALNLWGSHKIPFEDTDKSQTCNAPPLAVNPLAAHAVPPPCSSLMPAVLNEPRFTALDALDELKAHSTLFSTLSTVPNLKTDFPDKMMSFANQDPPTTSAGPQVSK